MTNEEIDLKAERVANVSLLTVNVAFILIILDKSPDTWALWGTQFLVALFLPALAASSPLAIERGQMAPSSFTFRVIGSGPSFGIRGYGLWFFSPVMAGGAVFLVAAVTVFICMGRDIAAAA